MEIRELSVAGRLRGHPACSTATTAACSSSGSAPSRSTEHDRPPARSSSRPTSRSSLARHRARHPLRRRPARPGQVRHLPSPASCSTSSSTSASAHRPSGSGTAVLLDTATAGRSTVAEGLGHAFCALEDDTTVTYLCSSGYNPAREHGIHPLDPELGLDWPGRHRAAAVAQGRRGAHPRRGRRPACCRRTTTASPTTRPCAPAEPAKGPRPRWSRPLRLLSTGHAGQPVAVIRLAAGTG